MNIYENIFKNDNLSFDKKLDDSFFIARTKIDILINSKMEQIKFFYTFKTIGFIISVNPLR